MFQDLRYAARVLLKNKGWTLTVVLSLAFGIGANTALFSAINGMLLRKVPVANPDTLVSLKYRGTNEMSTNRSEYGNFGREAAAGVRTTFSYAIYQELVKANRTMIGISASAPVDSVNAVIDGQAEVASAFVASGNYHDLLGVKAIRGRTIRPEDDQQGAALVAVISYGYWDRRFGKNPGAVGKVVQINNSSVVIVGVMQPEFTGIQRTLDNAPDFSLPIAFPVNDPRRLSQPTVWWVQIMGRLKPQTTIEQVQGNLSEVFRQEARQGMDSYLASLSPEERALSDNRNRTKIPQLYVTSGARGFYSFSDDDLRMVTILSVVVGLLLLIVCANVANLLLSRSSGRAKEIGVRLSIGATRRRLIRQLLTESFLLSFIGGALGLFVAVWAKGLLPRQTGQAPLDWNVLLFTAALTTFTGIAFGILPAFRATRRDINTGLQETSRNVIASRTRLGKTLVVVQVAVSLVLLVGSSLFLRTVQNLQNVEVGFNPQNLVLFRLNLRSARYDQKRYIPLYEQIRERVSGVAGVTAAGFSTASLLSGSEADTNMLVQGRDDVANPQNVINQLDVNSTFFSTMQIPIKQGRVFEATDGPESPAVAIINEAAVREFFPNENPIGRRFGTSPETRSRYEIIGVTADAKYNSLRDTAPPTVYFLYSQRQVPVPAVTFEVRTAEDSPNMIAALREAVRQVDPNVPLFAVSTQMQQIHRRFEQEWIFAQAYTLFGSVATLLASIGLFGLMSYSVARRTNEIGIRLALGAQRSDVLRMVMRESVLMVGIGLVIGLAVSLMTGRFVGSLLFDLAPTDPLSIGLAMAALSAVSALAGYLPARRAARVDPMIALHYE
jgi:predicted permease